MWNLDFCEQQNVHTVDELFESKNTAIPKLFLIWGHFLPFHWVPIFSEDPIYPPLPVCVFHLETTKSLIS